MERGQKVQVTDYVGRILVRRAVVDQGSTVVICNEEEYMKAQRERRQPNGVGFPRKDVLTAG